MLRGIPGVPDDAPRTAVNPRAAGLPSGPEHLPYPRGLRPRHFHLRVLPGSADLPQPGRASATARSPVGRPGGDAIGLRVCSLWPSTAVTSVQRPASSCSRCFSPRHGRALLVVMPCRERGPRPRQRHGSGDLHLLQFRPLVCGRATCPRLPRGGGLRPVVVRHAPARLLRIAIAVTGIGLAIHLKIDAYR